MLAFGPVAGQLESDSSLVCSGAIIAANKVPGVRVALVYDAETAQGVRVWSHANVLALSLRATSFPIVHEILDAWFKTSASEGEAQSTWNHREIHRIQRLEEKYRREGKKKN